MVVLKKSSVSPRSVTAVRSAQTTKALARQASKTVAKPAPRKVVKNYSVPVAPVKVKPVPVSSLSTAIPDTPFKVVKQLVSDPDNKS